MRKINLPVKLTVGFIFSNEGDYYKAKLYLEKRFGRIDFESQILPFIHTTYYEKELGKGLKRIFISFQRLILPEELPKIKIITQRIERKLSTRAGRRINIDPGYLNYAKLILASTKDYKHRIYLDKGIYAEVTLFYQNRDFHSWEWTYPDYKSGEYIKIFNRIRQIYAEQIRGR